MGMRVRLACQPLTWRNFAEAVKDIAEIGYNGIEAPVGAFLDRLDELKALLDEEYYRGMLAYNEAVRKVLDPIWEREYIAPHKARTISQN